jgi:hypothetical protein
MSKTGSSFPGFAGVEATFIGTGVVVAAFASTALFKNSTPSLLVTFVNTAEPEPDGTHLFVRERWPIIE